MNSKQIGSSHAVLFFFFFFGGAGVGSGVKS